MGSGPGRTNPRPPHTDFPQLAGSWSLTLVVDLDGKVKASIGKLDLDSRKMRWTEVGSRDLGSVGPVPPQATLSAIGDEVMLAAAAALRLG